MNDLLLPEYMLPLLLVMGIWDIVWKIFAMWKAAKNSSKVWFVVLMVFNTVGILPMIYLLISHKKAEKVNIITE
jgi:hypothetical protein